MITSFAVSNFRAFAQSGELDLAPVTCLVGRNSSGKSSLLHALLLLRQSIEQRPMGARVPQLNLTGSLLDAGSFENIVHRHDSEQQIGFQFQASVSLALPRPTDGIGASLVGFDVPRPPAGRLWHPSPSTFFYLQRRAAGKTRLVTVQLFFHPEPPFGPTLSRVEFHVDGIGSAAFVRTTGEERIQHWRSYTTHLPKKTLRMAFPPWAFFPQIRLRDEHATIAKADRKRVTEFVASVQLALRDIVIFLTELRLVGPFRTPPSRRYSFTGLGALDAGVSGERAVDLLITEKLVRPSGEYLRRGVSYWLGRLGLASGIGIKGLARKANLFELAVSGYKSTRLDNVADVGFGISQILPVIVQGFLVPRGGTYVVQQPELHLHPDAQAGLADFFLYLAAHGVRTIIETHSEYLLVRLRRRLAEGAKVVQVGIPGEKETTTKPLGRADVSVVYVDHARGTASLRKLEIGDAFQFENLPPGFMSQAVDDRVALMKAVARARR